MGNPVYVKSLLDLGSALGLNRFVLNRLQSTLAYLYSTNHIGQYNESKSGGILIAWLK